MNRRDRTPFSAICSALLLALFAAACTGGRDADVAELPATDESPSDQSDSESDEAETAAADSEGDSEGDQSFDGALNVVVPNSPGTLSTTGAQRVMTALLGAGPNSFLGGPNQPVTVRFDAVNSGDTGEAEGEWLTTNAAALGLYVSYFDFPSAGPWEIVVSADGEELGRALVEVVEDSTVPNIGDPAPPSQSPTGRTAEELTAISTDLEPDPALYELSIAEAVDNGRPTLLAFATPAFCQTALCGPTLETVKAAAADRDDIDVVHVEPFDLELAPQGVLEPIPAMADWGLVTEPWVFVIDADGLVAATFEGIIGQGELEAALARVS